jgi:hypothetical protein
LNHSLPQKLPEKVETGSLRKTVLACVWVQTPQKGQSKLKAFKLSDGFLGKASSLCVSNNQ